MEGLAVPIFMGFLSTAAFLITLGRMDIRKFMGYPVLLDIVGTVMFAALFHSTLTGMMTAVIAALSMAFSITMYRRWFGYKRFNLRNRVWVYYPPRQCKVSQYA